MKLLPVLLLLARDTGAGAEHADRRGGHPARHSRTQPSCVAAGAAGTALVRSGTAGACDGVVERVLSAEPRNADALILAARIEASRGNSAAATAMLPGYAQRVAPRTSRR